MRRRLTIVPILLAAALVLSLQPARAQQTFFVFFSTWSSELDPAARDVIKAAAAYARANPALRIDVTGTANTNGSAKANLYLSLLRAQLVSDMLVEAGIDPARITRVGEGEVTAIGGEEESRRVGIRFRTR
ncbi:MAG: OmpA family protein [Acetobacteraceae bacterium]|nr:OmpA family protein [Acetobacteraceae bacterium]